MCAGQYSTQGTGQGIGQGQGRMQAQGMGRGSGQVHGQALASSSHTTSSSGSGSASAPIPGHGLVSLGSLPSLSPHGPGSLLSPPSGLGNLFNAEASSTFADFGNPIQALTSQCQPVGLSWMHFHLRSNLDLNQLILACMVLAWMSQFALFWLRELTCMQYMQCCSPS